MLKETEQALIKDFLTSPLTTGDLARKYGIGQTTVYLKLRVNIEPGKFKKLSREKHSRKMHTVQYLKYVRKKAS